MFSLSDWNQNVVEKNIRWGDAETKYPDKYMVVTNTHIVDTQLYGDIIAVFTPSEYSKINIPEPTLPNHYSVWEGLSIKMEGMGTLGFYL